MSGKTTAGETSAVRFLDTAVGDGGGEPHAVVSVKRRVYEGVQRQQTVMN